MRFLICTKSTNDYIKVGEIFPAYCCNGLWKIVFILPQKDEVNVYPLDCWEDGSFSIMEWGLENADFKEVDLCQYLKN